ncbi:hypothetical protein GCM10020331_055850 [Ectobacillus funiculus]
MQRLFLLGESGVGKTVFLPVLYIIEASEKKGAFLSKSIAGLYQQACLNLNYLDMSLVLLQEQIIKGKIGIIELAHKGTLFLDEIGELPLDIQVKLFKSTTRKKV